MTIKNKLTKTLFSVLLSITLMLEVIMPSVMISFAATGNEYAGGAGNAVSDRDTSTKYSESLGDNASTEYAGRVWTDRSVYTDDVTFDTFGGGQETITLNAGDNLGEDFLVAYSALATSMSVSGQSHSPVDVVLILDISGSMSNQSSNMDNNKSRIYNAVQAANTAIDSLMEMNPYNRVAVVAFSSTAQTLLPLDRYTKTASNVSYFTLSGETGSSNNATLYTRAIGTASGTIEKNTSVSGGTNIQMGLYQGMNLLANETSTKANINGTNIQRTPSVILLSDGAPTFSSDSRSWWAPSNNDDDGPGDDAYAGNGMKAILTGSYMKKAIDRNYGVANTSFATTVYTVGMGITNLSGSQKNLAYMTLDPGTYWNDNTSNTMKTTIKNYWSSYTANNNTGTLNINVGTSGFFSSTDKNYYLTHPTTGYDVDAVDGYNYVDDYYDADNASAITTVFDEIVANINISSPQVPTEIKGDNPLTDGYITYTDPIGEYMEVKDVKAIIYAGQKFTAKNVATNGNTTTYTFSGSVNNAVYGQQELNNIIITVEKEASGNEVITIKIPAAVIPLRVNSVVLNEDGSVKTHTNNGAFPARIIYSIGLQSEIVKQADDGSYYIDKSKISAEYLAQNTTADGNINFYSSLYSNSKTVNGSTVGDATVEFEPSHTNGFYYILEDMPIYKDSEFKNQVPASEGLDDDTVYYYKDEYYHGNSTEVAAIARTGAQLKRTEIKTGADGYLYRSAGSPRLNRILKFEGTKVQNITQTAEDFYAPTFEHAPGSTDPYEGKFVIYLGNNGVLSLAAGGNLKISKTVNASNGTTAPDATFEFTIDLNGSNVNGGTYDYTISNADGAVASTGTVSAANPKVYLKDSQTATIFSLPPNTTYQVTETAVAGFTSYSEGATGTIQNGSTAVAEFTNTYNVTPITFPVNNDLGGTKVLTGRNWQVGTDSFTFLIRPYNNAPLPDGYDAVNGITVNQPNTTVNGDDAATFDFGTIEFTAPGVYRYTIAEQEPENDAYLPGISYSRALYRLVVTVTDNGDGTMSADAEIQKLYDDSANPLFTYVNNEIVMNAGQEAEDAIVFVNTYVANAVTRVPVATKNYTDNSGQNPLVSGMFEFKLEAIGVVENNMVVPNSISSVPMPTADRFVTTSNEGHNITFPAVSFAQDVIPQGADSITFRYQMSEVIPDVADRVNGMTYDDTIYTVDVVVSIDPNSHELNVSPMYSNDQRVAVFENVYTPTPVTADINGTKTLIGRDMKNNESFEFVLGSNASTGNAIRDGIVVIPANSNVATVTDAKDNVAKAFAFEDVTFKKAGTYVFTVSETQGNSLAVEYDDSVITVTIIVDDADKDGNLEIASTTYSNGKNAAEFTNVYSSTFSGNPVSLSGAKELTGKTLLEGEFYFNVEKYYNGTIINQGLVTHTKDVTGNNGVYSGAISFIEDDTYDKEGTYEYYISEFIPVEKVKGTVYDQSKYRLTVIVEDNLDGSLIITSTKKEISDGSTWSEVSDIVFANTYTPDPTTATLPLINKIISGDRSKPLQDNEFQFELKAVSANPSDGMTLPSATIVSNAANGNIIFDAITFSKAGTYIVSVKEIIPDDANKVAGITYSTQEIVATYRVTDDRNGNLTAVLTQFVGGDDIINRYNPEAAEAQIEISKSFTGRQNNEWLATDSFDFTISALDDETKQAIANGEIEFQLDNGSTDTATKTINAKGQLASHIVKVNKAGTYKFKVSEVQGNIPGVAYDTNDYDVVIVATDDSANAKIKLNINNQNTDKITLDFSNTYSVQSTNDIEFSAVKKVTSPKDNAYSFVGGEFKFTLKDEQGKTIATATNDKNGNIVFDKFVIDAAGTYRYVVYEENTAVKNITYDKTKYIVELTVEDNTTGKLVVTKTVITKENSTDEISEIVFENVYTPEAPATSPDTGVDSTNYMNLLIALFFISTSCLTATLFYGIKKYREE
ncbi:MAG: VWA domain-containing protein [Ruminococcaceae bacterium]|nr:VWA domain-containing protein [Oscillospiraceae bacterium]